MSNSFTGNEVTFNTATELYEKMRPGYVPELYADVFAYGNITSGCAALEIGPGTGQATKPVLDAGVSVTAVELGDNLAAFCAEKFKSYPGFSVITSDFGQFDHPENSFDLAFSATAFHWIPEEIGYPKVFSLLKPGAVFARFANRPWKDKGNEPLHQAIQEAYAKYMSRSKSSPEFSEEKARSIAVVAEKYGFTDIQYKLYKRTRTFTADEYSQLLCTYSDHIALPEESKAPFHAMIKDAINSHGGTITIYDTIDLELCRKPY